MLCVGLKDVEGLARARCGSSARPPACASASPARPRPTSGSVVDKLDREIVSRIRREVRDDELGAVVRIHVRR